MTQNLAVQLTREVLTMTILISMPMLGVGLVVGLAISIFQTTTSIQEQTLTFVPKLFAILISVAFFGPWMIRMMTEYFKTLITTMASVG